MDIILWYCRIFTNKIVTAENNDKINVVNIFVDDCIMISKIKI